MEDNKTQTTGGVGFLGLLAVLFIALKLTGYIAWSWWWVTAPLWGPVALFAIAAGILIARILFVSKGKL